MKFVAYALLANREDSHDLRYLGQIDAPEGNSHADSRAQEKAVDELISGIVRDQPGSAEEDPWSLLPAVLGDGGNDAYECVVLWPVETHHQVNQPAKRPLRLGWAFGQNPMPVSL